MLRSPAVALSIVMLAAAAACSSAPEQITRSEAVAVWSDTYATDCFAPRDIGTSEYPLDRLDDDCVRVLLEEVELVEEDEFCFTRVWQSTWKFSDDPGYGSTDIQRSRACYPMYRDDDGTVQMWSASEVTELGTLAQWPEG